MEWRQVQLITQAVGGDACRSERGFMGLFNDAYNAVARSICTLGKHTPPVYYTKPSAKAVRLQEQIEKYPEATAVEIEGALDDAAQQGLVTSQEKLIGVNAPSW